MSSAKAIELEKLAWCGDLTAELIDKELKAAFDIGVQRMKRRTRFANNATMPDNVHADNTSYVIGFNTGSIEQRKAIDDLPLPEWDEC